MPFDSGAGLLKPKAVVVAANGVTPDPSLAEELQLFVRGRIAAYKCPRLIEFVPDLPKTATGKIQPVKLRQATSTSTPGSAGSVLYYSSTCGLSSSRNRCVQ